MAANIVVSSGPSQSKDKMGIAKELHNKANLVLESKQNSNQLCEILELFNKEESNFTPLLLTVELIFSTMLRRGDLVNHISTSSTATPEEVHSKWLRETYEIAYSRVLACMAQGEEQSRVQAMVTAMKLFTEESLNPVNNKGRIEFRSNRIRAVVEALLHPTDHQTALINRFQEYAEYRDVQSCGLRLLASGQKHKNKQIFIQNYLELFDALLKPCLPQTPRVENARSEEDRYLCEKDGYVPLLFNPLRVKAHINSAWSRCMKWHLRGSESTHRRALVLLVDRVMPHLRNPELATDFIFDSLDCGTALSMIALRGMLELVTKYKINYPDLYDKLYAMFEPEMFATRSKRRLIGITDVFLSSTHLSAALVAAFAKRLSRLALVASPEDATALLQLVSNIIQRHPVLKKMLRHDQPPIMPQDPYVMEETTAEASQAIHSSLWEVSALKQHFTPEVSAAAARLLAVAETNAKPPPLPASTPDQEMEIAEEEKPASKKDGRGRRIVDINHFVKQIPDIASHGLMGCTSQTLELEGEKQNGLMSTFTFRCKMCDVKFCNV